MRQSDPSALFSLVAPPTGAKGLRAAAHARESVKDRAEPFEPTLPTNEPPARPRAERRGIDRRDIDRRDDSRRDASRRDASRRDEVSPRESRASEARPHDIAKTDRKLKDAKTGPKPREDDDPKVAVTDDEPVDATAEVKTGSDETVDGCQAAPPADGASDTPADDTAQPLVLAALLGNTEVAAAVPEDVAAPPQLVDEGAEHECATTPAPVQELGEAGRGRGLGRIVSSAVHAVIATATGKGAGAGAANGATAAEAGAEDAPSADQHLGPEVSAAAKVAIEGAGKGLALGVAAKLTRETPTREAAPDIQRADLKPADLSSPANLPNGANAAHAAQALRESDPATESRGRQPVVRDVPLGAVPIEIGMRAMAGVRRFDIRLDPPDLGRIDVRLDMGDDGTVKAHLTVDKVETLALLQRDARTLERAFEQAGLKPSDSGVDLTLRDHTFAGHRHGAGGEQERSSPPAPTFIPADQADEQPVHLLWRGTTGLDVRV